MLDLDFPAAARSLRRSPGFVIAAVLSLTLVTGGVMSNDGRRGHRTWRGADGQAPKTTCKTIVAQ